MCFSITQKNLIDSNYFKKFKQQFSINKSQSKMFKSNLFMFLGLVAFCDKNKKNVVMNKLYWKVASDIW